MKLFNAFLIAAVAARHCAPAISGSPARPTGLVVEEKENFKTNLILTKISLTSSNFLKLKKAEKVKKAVKKAKDEIKVEKMKSKFFVT